MTCRKIYAVYSGDDTLLAVGTAPEVARQLNIAEGTVRWYANSKRKEGYRYAVAQEPEKDRPKPKCHHKGGRGTSVRVLQRSRYGVKFKMAVCEVCGRKTDYCATSEEARRRAYLGLWKGWTF